MYLADIRARMNYPETLRPTMRDATRLYLLSVNDLHSRFPIALTLTLKQHYSTKNTYGVHFSKTSKDDAIRAARRFLMKLNRCVFLKSAERHGLALRQIVVLHGLSNGKNLHFHMVLGGFPSTCRFSSVPRLIERAKSLVPLFDKQYDVQICDSGWIDYITHEVSSHDTDAVVWELCSDR